MNSRVWVMGLEVVEVLVDLPVRDPRAVALDLEPLDREERLDDLRAERPAQDRVALERLQGCIQRGGQGRADQLPVRAVCVTIDGPPRATTCTTST